MADLYSGENGKVALMEMGNSLTSKILKKFGYRIIDVDLSEFNKFGFGIRHLRNQCSIG
jgi:N-dimethylarginine dimethylaminohydrolase